MAKVLQHRRNTTSNLASVSGAIGEFFMDTTKNTLVVMDGSTNGGHPLAKANALSQLSEVLSTKTGATGTVDHDFTASSIFYHTSAAADFTANITNVPTTDDRTTNIVLVIVQGATPYLPTALQIGGSAVTIKWQGGSAPSGTASQVDVVSFTLIRTGAAWTALGVLNTFN